MRGDSDGSGSQANSVAEGAHDETEPRIKKAMIKKKETEH